MTFFTAGRQTVLIVDDEPDILTSLSAIIQARYENVRVLKAPSAADARKLARENRVDTIVADYRMATTNGIELLEELRLQKPDVPRILMTAYPDPEVLASAVNRAGVHGVLLKPLNLEKALGMIQEMLKKQAGAKGRIPPFNR